MNMTSFDADRVRDERVRNCCVRSNRSLDNLKRWIVRGQYGSGRISGRRDVPGYRREQALIRFLRLKLLWLPNSRWKTGAGRVSPLPAFRQASGRKNQRNCGHVQARTAFHVFADFALLICRKIFWCSMCSPEEGIALTIQAKHPGHKLCMSSLEMDFHYQDIYGIEPPESYERLLLDAMLGEIKLCLCAMMT